MAAVAEEGAAPVSSAPIVKISETEVFVGNLPFGYDEAAVKEVFAKYGAISKVVTTKRFVTLTFEATDSAAKALAEQEQDFGGRPMRVEARAIRRKRRAKRTKKAKVAGEEGAAAAPADGEGAGDVRRRRNPKAKSAAAAPANEKVVEFPNRVYVGSLAEGTTEAQVTDALQSVGGTVQTFRFSQDLKSAIANMASAEMAEEIIIALNGKQVNGATVVVEKARGSRNRNGGGRKARTEGGAGEDSAPRPPNPRKVFVGGIPEDTTIQAIKDVFGGNPRVHKRKQVHILTFATEEEAQAALAKSGSTLFGGVAQTIDPPRLRAAAAGAAAE